MRNLDLSNNKLETIDDGLLRDLVKLDHLKLKENNIKVFEQQVKGKIGRQRRKRWLEQIDKCDSSDQVCLGVIEENKLYKRSASYFIFRPAESAIRLIHNYFYNPFEDRSNRNIMIGIGGLPFKGSHPSAMGNRLTAAPIHGLQDFLMNNNVNFFMDNPLPLDKTILIGRMHHSCDEFRKERAQRIAELNQGHETKNISVVLDSNALSTYKNHEYLRNLFSESIQDVKDSVIQQVKAPETSRVSDKKNKI